MPETPTRSFKCVGGWLAIAVFLAAGGAAFYLRGCTGQNALRFDPELWRRHEHNEDGYSRRYKMVGDLLRKHGLIGMTRDEVEALLGPIEYLRVNDLYPYPGWDLGQKSGWFSLPHGTTLMVEFGPDGRVVKVWNPGR